MRGSSQGEGLTRRLTQHVTSSGTGRGEKTLPNMSPRAELGGAGASPTHVTSSGTGRRGAAACGVERSPEEYEGSVLLSRSPSAVGTVAMTGSGDGVRSRLHGARTTPGISPRARSARLVEITNGGKARLVEMTGRGKRTQISEGDR